MTHPRTHHLLRRHRLARGWSTAQLAAVTGPGVTAPMVERLEAGHPHPDPDVVQQILTGLGLDAAELYRAALADLTTPTRPVEPGWVPGSYRVHLPQGPPVTDHRLLTLTRAGAPATAHPRS